MGCLMILFCQQRLEYINDMGLRHQTIIMIQHDEQEQY